MEAAVKMQSMTAGKVSGGQKLVSQGTSVKNDNFNKLLQVKKDQAESADLESAKKPETGKPEEPKTEAGKPESGKTEDTSAKKPSDGTEESSADEMKEDVEAARQLEALQQVLLQQAAVQITEVEPEQQAVVEPAAAEGLVTEAAEAVTLEGTKVTESPHQANGGTEAESASITEIKAAETQEKTSKPVEPEKTQEPETVENTELKVTEPVKTTRTLVQRPIPESQKVRKETSGVIWKIREIKEPKGQHRIPECISLSMRPEYFLQTAEWSSLYFRKSPIRESCP